MQAQAEPHVVRFDVTNVRTGAVKSFKSRDAAMKAADRTDHAFGAVCCVVKAVWSDQV